MPVAHKARPIKTKRKEEINPVNLEKIFDHFDQELGKLYGELGDKGIISRTVLSGGGGSSIPGPTSASDENHIIFALVGRGT